MKTYAYEECDIKTNNGTIKFQAHFDTADM